MGFRASRLKEITKKTTLGYGAQYGEPMPLNVEYRPEALSVEDMDFIVANGQTAIADTVIAYLLKVLVDWDVEGDDGKTLPIDEPSIRYLGHTFAEWLIMELVKDARPNAQTPTRSLTGSSKAGSRR
jgi:hypothetical protein